MAPYIAVATTIIMAGLGFFFSSLRLVDSKVDNLAGVVTDVRVKTASDISEIKTDVKNISNVIDRLDKKIK